MRQSGTCTSVVVMGAMIVCMSFMVVPFTAHTSLPLAPAVKVVPTEVCTCSNQTRVNTSGTIRFQPGFGSALYDEQLGMTFTQNFKSMEYNVTAVEQTDPSLGDGPAYLLDGLSNVGYWYQVGVSWNWGPGQTPGTGFDMNYEVFDSAGASIFPSNGQGGVLAFSGPVSDGNTITLDLYFSNSTHQVVMLAEDRETGASASESYSSDDATFFMGLPQSVASTQGFFTGLMTEWYHGTPYFADEAEVIYSSPGSPISSAWMWMDEFDTSSLTGVFTANTSAPISYGDPTRLQEFSFNGTTEYSDAYEFITGALTNGTLQTSPSVPLTLSFSVLNGTGYSAPDLTYVSNGTTYNVPLTGTATVYYADPGTPWTVSAILDGSTGSVRWSTDQVAGGIAERNETVQFAYYYQDYITFMFGVTGGGSGYSPPIVSYVSFGSSITTPVGTGVWADAGSRYQFSSPLAGSNATARWSATPYGNIGSAHEVTVMYYRQYLGTFDIAFRNTEIFPGLSLRSTSEGLPYSATVVSGSNKEWLDAGSSYSVQQSYAYESGQRLITNGSTSGSVSGGFTVSLVYEHQFYIGITGNIPGGGTVSPQSGWYDSGSTLQLDATVGSGWQFETWQGTGSDSASGSSPMLALTVGPGAPSNETAVFYAGVTIDAKGPESVSYSDGSDSGSVSGGTSKVVYLPPSSVVSLTASNAALLTSFGGWSGSNNTSKSTISLQVAGPVTISSNSGYDYGGIILVLGIAVIAVAATVVLERKRRSPRAALITRDDSGSSTEQPVTTEVGSERLS